MNTLVCTKTRGPLALLGPPRSAPASVDPLAVVYRTRPEKLVSGRLWSVRPYMACMLFGAYRKNFQVLYRRRIYIFFFFSFRSFQFFLKTRWYSVDVPLAAIKEFG